MEYKLKKDRIAVCEIAFDSFTELPIESDLLLPDYCPDIVKVLKCQARPAFSKTEVSGDKCILEGATAITVYYTGEDEQLRTSEHKVDFLKTLELKTTPQNPIVFCSLKEDYLNCKAIISMPDRRERCFYRHGKNFVQHRRRDDWRSGRSRTATESPTDAFQRIGGNRFQKVLLFGKIWSWERKNRRWII